MSSLPVMARACQRPRRFHHLFVLVVLLIALLSTAAGVGKAAPRSTGPASSAAALAPMVAGPPTLATTAGAVTAIVAGPETPVNDWATSTLQAGNKAITALVDLPDGRIFAAIQNDGIRVYAPDANGLYSWQSGPTGGPTNVTALAYLNGQLWAGTSNAGLSVFTLRLNSWSTFTSANSPLPSNTINRLTAVDRPNGPDDLWVSTTAGAARYRQITGNPATWQIFTTADGLPSNGIYDVANWEFGNTTITYFATDAGVRSYNGTTMSAVNGGTGCLFDRATRIIVDRANLIWFAAEVNIPALAAPPADTVTAAAAVWQPIGACRYAFSGFGGIWTAHSQSTLPWPSNKISDMSVDRSGRVWFSFLPLGNGSTGGGAAFDRGHWLVLKQPTAPLVTALVNHVQAVGEAVWFGHGDASAFSVYSPNWSYWGQGDLAVSAAPAALLLESDESWVGAGTQLSHWNGQSWQVLTIPGNSPVAALTRGGDGQLWIGTATDGLYAYDTNTFTHYTTADGLADNAVRALHRDAAGRLWVATASGLTLRGSGSWLAFTAANSDLAGDDLRALTSDNSGRLWIGTAANGIAILDPEANGTPAWSSQTTADGLPANGINGLATAPDGAVWAATAAGVAKWDPASETWSTFTASNGLASNEILAVAADPTGLIWVGTTAGVARYDGTDWLALRVTGSFLGADRVPGIAADESRLWALGGNQVAVRSTNDRADWQQAAGDSLDYPEQKARR
ncbi:MAG: two-component regulator propeller domain-containing protein [Caldilineaceae bacterium]